MDERDQLAPGSEGCREVGSVSVDVIIVTDAMQQSKGWNIWLIWGDSCGNGDILGSWWV